MIRMLQNLVSTPDGTGCEIREGVGGIGIQSKRISIPNHLFDTVLHPIIHPGTPLNLPRGPAEEDHGSLQEMCKCRL
jgi:hypothetical protein